MTDKALLGTSDEPAHVVGHGPVPAQQARDLVRCAASAWTRRLYTHSRSGALVAMDSRRRFFSGQLRHLLILDNDTGAPDPGMRRVAAVLGAA